MTDDDLERLIGESLKRLPTPQAPPSLLPRVMASVRQRSQLPWYSRGWRRWPLAWRATAFAVFAVAVATGAVVIPTIQTDLVADFSSVADTAVGPLVAVVRGMTAVAGVAGPMWRVFVQPVWGYMFLVSLVLGTSCAAIGFALSRVTLGGAAQS